jgi:hypothetical protein
MRVLLLLAACATTAWSQAADTIPLSRLDSHYARAQHAFLHDDHAAYVAVLSGIAFGSDASPARSAVLKVDRQVQAVGVSAAIEKVGIPATSATDALSLLGEHRLRHGDADAARPLLALATVQRATTLVQALESEPIGFTYTTLSDALISARNVRNTYKYLNEPHGEENPNLFRDLYNLAIALTRTGHADKARAVLTILAEEPAARGFQTAAHRALGR